MPFFGGRDLQKLIDVLRAVTESGKALTTGPMYMKATDYAGDPEDQFIHSVVPIHGIDGNQPQHCLFTRRRSRSAAQRAVLESPYFVVVCFRYRIALADCLFQLLTISDV